MCYYEKRNVFYYKIVSRENWQERARQAVLGLMQCVQNVNSGCVTRPLCHIYEKIMSITESKMKSLISVSVCIMKTLERSFVSL